MDDANGSGGVQDQGQDVNQVQDQNTTPDNSDNQQQLDSQALAEENKRLKGTVSALQKKYLDSTRQRGTAQQPSQDGNQDAEVFSTAFDLADAKVRSGLENVIPLYDGTQPSYEGEPALSPEDIARIRKNPMAFVSLATMKQYFLDGNVEPVLLEIEQTMADRAARLSANNNKGSGGKQVNPSPAPEAGANQGQKQGSADLWTMPMDQLEQLKDAQVQQASAQ